MERKQIKGFDIKPPSKKAFAIDTHEDYPKLHTLCIASATRGSGKTTAIVNLIKKAQDDGYFDRVIIVTPTYHSNKNIFDLMDYDEEDVLEPDVKV